MDKHIQNLLKCASKIAKCEECDKFYDCDSFYSNNNIYKCAIDVLLNEIMRNNG